MALLLTIDTTTSVCSVALSKNGKLTGLKENNDGKHSVLLATYTDELLKENDILPSQLDAVVISMGPGSYTGLRIGVSFAKGICFATGKPLIAVPTLQALALSVSEKYTEDAYYCPMLDARRMEVYTALFDRDNNTVIDTKAEIIDRNSFTDILATHKIYFFGNGSDKVKHLITGPNACYIEQIETSAKHLIPLAEQKYLAGRFEDVAYFEPLYLKDFIATTPKKT